MTKKSNNLLALITIIMGFFMALLDTNIVNVVMPEITNYYDANIKDISWVVNAYNLAFAVFLLTATRLADQFGRKKAFIVGLFLFTGSSLLCGLANSVKMLVFFRVIQGLGAALIVPVTAPLAIELFPPEKKGMVGGIWGAFGGLAAASGPALGGILTDKLSWEWIFFINVPIGIVTIILTFFIIKESYDTTAGRKIDWMGVLTLSVGLFTLILGLIQANDYGWNSTYILTLLGVAVVSLILFLIIESKVSEPMLQLNLFRISPFTAGNISFFMLGIGMMSALFLLAFFLTSVDDMSELRAGLLLSVVSLTSMFVSGITGPLSDKVGTRWFGVVGLILLSAGVYTLGSLDIHASTFELIWRLMLIGAGIGMTIAPMSGATVLSVPYEKVGIASGVMNMSRTLGTAFGVAILIALLNNQLDDEFQKAKQEVEKVVQSSQLTSETKSEAIKEIKGSKLSENSKPMTIDETLKKVDQKEKEVLSNTPPAQQPFIKAAFSKERTEIKKIWPNIESGFKSHVANAFHTTFQISCIFILIGAFFAFFNGQPGSAKIQKVGNQSADSKGTPISEL